jgi:hypothetical protein
LAIVLFLRVSWDSVYTYLNVWLPLLPPCLNTTIMLFLSLVKKAGATTRQICSYIFLSPSPSLLAHIRVPILVKLHSCHHLLLKARRCIVMCQCLTLLVKCGIQRIRFPNEANIWDRPQFSDIIVLESDLPLRDEGEVGFFLIPSLNARAAPNLSISLPNFKT